MSAEIDLQHRQRRIIFRDPKRVHLGDLHFDIVGSAEDLNREALRLKTKGFEIVAMGLPDGVAGGNGAGRIPAPAQETQP